MKTSCRKFLLVFCILILSALACTGLTPEHQAQIIREATLTAEALNSPHESLLEPSPQPSLDVTQLTPDKTEFENMDDKIVFSYAGENQSYHTGLRNRTVFYIDYETGKVIASEVASFEESAGTDMTRRGTDTVKFDGTYDAITMTISGNFNIYTQGTATGGSGYSDNTVTYKMEGILSAQFVNGQWAGTVNGTSTLSQVWPGSEQYNEVTTHAIEWTITGISGN